MSLTIRSSAFAQGETIPPKYTCDGADTSPPLEWAGVPDTTMSLALIVDDPDAPDPAAPTRRWVHWVLYNIPPDARGLSEGAGAGKLPPGALEGTNDFERSGYGGPCPPKGRHRYFFTLHALDEALTLVGSPTRADVESAMRGHVLARAELMGTYERPR